MPQVPTEWQDRQEALIEELLGLGPFRRGTLTERWRRCGHPTCACARPEHPGHGPQTILTYKEDGVTRTVNLPTAAAVAVVRGQLETHEQFLGWAKRWRTVQEAIAADRLRQALAASETRPTATADEARKKKLRRGLKRKSRGKSKR